MSTCLFSPILSCDQHQGNPQRCCGSPLCSILDFLQLAGRGLFSRTLDRSKPSQLLQSAIQELLVREGATPAWHNHFQKGCVKAETLPTNTATHMHSDTVIHAQSFEVACLPSCMFLRILFSAKP